ncbi:MAG: hypothetical protein IH949_02010 [Bacteroidetes bacterium]|nr:hypothetical protein [Bacteroidota bacterium]
MRIYNASEGKLLLIKKDILIKTIKSNNEKRKHYTAEFKIRILRENFEK